MKPIIQKTVMIIATLWASISASAYDFELDGIYYNITSETEHTVGVTQGDYSGDVEIPQTLTHNNITYTVTSIENVAFSSCTGLTSIIIPESVAKIGRSAFSRCTSLTSVAIPNSVTEMGMYTFNRCSNLTSVTLSNSLTTLNSGIFSQCTSLASVTIPESVTTLEGNTFFECSGLMSVTIPNSVTKIGTSAFYGCTSLTSATIPESVTAIGPSAFYGCSALTSLTIPNSVTSIGGNAFFGTNRLETIYNQIAAPFYCDPRFSNDNYNNTVLYIPTGSLSAYMEVSPWCNFLNIVEKDYSAIEGVESDGDFKTEVGRYNLHGLEVGPDYKGLTIIKYSDGSYCKKHAN